MIEIGLNKISKSFGFDKVLNDISLEVKTNERVALVGDNGSGKTTLLNIVAGNVNVDSGEVAIRQKRKIGYLRQSYADFDKELLVKEILYSNVSDIIQLKNKLLKYENKLSNVKGSKIEDVLNKYLRLQDEFINIGGYEIDSRVEKVVSGFNINKELLNKKIGMLSGGEKTIVYFASIIIGEPDILILDEPTNHLDIETLNWLENYLNNYKGTILMVSHDRYFLNKVATKIVLIERGNIEVFNGNYDYFLIENENRILKEFKDYKDQQKEIKALKNKIKQLEEFGRKASPSSGEIFFRRANSIRKRLDKIEVLNRPMVQNDINLSFDGKRSGNEVIKAECISILYKDKVLLDNANLEIYYRDRICLFGGNGCGKTSLIKDILNNSLKYKIGSNVRIGYIEQEIVFENDKITILDEARKYFVGEEYQLRSALHKFNFFGDNVYKRLDILSGGEKVRLKLFCLMQNNNNFLILDEPTNHIDISTREVLENALLKFDGTILMVSHDRYFINKLVNRIIYFKDKKLINYLGNYDEYSKIWKSN